MFPVIGAKPWAEQKTEGLKSPDQNIQAFKHSEPVDHG